MTDKREMVRHPHHYNAKGERAPDGTSVYEPVKVIESWGLADGFYLGSALKYILRAKHKENERQDLEKALWYLERLRDYRMAQDKGEKKDFLLPMKVGWAWDLSKDLFLAIEHIANDHPGGAAWKVAEELTGMKLAKEMAADVDQELLGQVREQLTQRSDKDSLVKIVNEMKLMAKESKKDSKDKYEGQADHEAAGWEPEK